jgi:hypothetical protein
LSGIAPSQNRLPELARTEIGLLFLVASEIGSAILQPFLGFLPLNADPLYTYPTGIEIYASLIMLFFVGGVLIVSGRRPFGPKHSGRAVLGLALWIGVTVSDLFLLPAWFPALTTFFPPYAAGAVIDMVSAAVSVTAIALLTFNLQSPRGKILLWLGIITGLSLTIAFDSQNLHVFPYYSNIVQQTLFAAGGLSPALFAAAFIAAWSRLRNQDYFTTQKPRPLADSFAGN